MKDDDDYNKLAQDAVRKGGAVVEIGFLLPYELEWGKWHRSKETKGGESPFASYLLNKKWTMEEEFNNHMMRFNQVTVSSLYLNKQHFDIPGRIDSH